MERWFFYSAEDLVRVAVIGTLAYVGLILVHRVSGKRTLSKMNAFDLVVTVALGSTLATILLSKDVSLSEGLTAFALLVALQYLVTKGSLHTPWIARLVKSEPTLLFFDGEFLREPMRRERVREDEILAAIRSQNIASVEDVLAVVLETQAELSVIRRGGGRPTALGELAPEAAMDERHRNIAERTD